MPTPPGPVRVTRGTVRVAQEGSERRQLALAVDQRGERTGHAVGRGQRRDGHGTPPWRRSREWAPPVWWRGAGRLSTAAGAPPAAAGSPRCSRFPRTTCLSGGPCYQGNTSRHVKTSGAKAGSAARARSMSSSTAGTAPSRLTVQAERSGMGTGKRCTSRPPAPAVGGEVRDWWPGRWGSGRAPGGPRGRERSAASAPDGPDSPRPTAPQGTPLEPRPGPVRADYASQESGRSWAPPTPGRRIRPRLRNAPVPAPRRGAGRRWAAFRRSYPVSENGSGR